MLVRKKKWTHDDHTNAAWTTRSATVIPPERFRWITNENDDPAYDNELYHEWPLSTAPPGGISIAGRAARARSRRPSEEKARRREEYHADLCRQFGGIDIRSPAYDLNGKVLEGMHAVFVLTPDKEPEPHDQT